MVNRVGHTGGWFDHGTRYVQNPFARPFHAVHGLLVARECTGRKVIPAYASYKFTCEFHVNALAFTARCWVVVHCL